MISLFGNPEPTCEPSPIKDVPPTDKPLALRRLAEMLEKDAAARARQESGEVHELDSLTSRLRGSDPEDVASSGAAGSPSRRPPCQPLGPINHDYPLRGQRSAGLWFSFYGHGGHGNRTRFADFSTIVPTSS